MQESFVLFLIAGAIPRTIFGIGATNALLPFLF
jgi:hypothetical protein